MMISGNNKLSQLKTCLEAAHNFLLSQDEAKEIFDHQIQTINDNWEAVCDEATLNEVDRRLLWSRQFLNPYSVIR